MGSHGEMIREGWERESIALGRRVALFVNGCIGPRSGYRAGLVGLVFRGAYFPLRSYANGKSGGQEKGGSHALGSAPGLPSRSEDLSSGGPRKTLLAVSSFA